MAPLHGAFPLAESGEAARAIAKDLNLDVARALDPSLRIERAVAKGGCRLRAAARERVRDFVAVANDPHPAPAAARHRLQHHRRAVEPLEERLGFRWRCD